MAFVYIIKCSDNTYYTGIAKDIKKRIKEHYLKTNNCAKYTRARDIVSLERLWRAKNMSEAARLEWHIKSLSRVQKQDLINNPDKLGNVYCYKLIDLEFILELNITLEKCLLDE